MRLLGTWKNKLSYADSISLSVELASRYAVSPQHGFTLTIFPPMAAMSDARRRLPDWVGMGAQNTTWDAPHAITGETAPSMLKDIGCEMVMIGHSERRTFLGETNEVIGLKAASAIAHGLTALVCIGETYEERVEEKTEGVLEQQLRPIIELLRDNPSARLLIAYEPAWAITTNKEKLPADPTLAAKDHAWIRAHLKGALGPRGGEVELIYGAGVNTENVRAFLDTENVDGVLAGGASQKPDSLFELIDQVSEAVEKRRVQ